MTAPYLLRAGADAGRCHLEGEAEDRQVLAWVILVAGQLRQAVVDRARLLALVDRRIEIDEVPAGLAGRLHEDLDVALAVEAAGIAGMAVVVDHRVDVGGLGPARALEMDGELRADRTAGHIERQRAGRHPIGAELALF